MMVCKESIAPRKTTHIILADSLLVPLSVLLTLPRPWAAIAEFIGKDNIASPAPAILTKLRRDKSALSALGLFTFDANARFTSTLDTF
jgi:hypothetical protein